jgi:hypothetical protein
MSWNLVLMADFSNYRQLKEANNQVINSLNHELQGMNGVELNDSPDPRRIQHTLLQLVNMASSIDNIRAATENKQFGVFKISDQKKNRIIADCGELELYITMAIKRLSTKCQDNESHFKDAIDSVESSYEEKQGQIPEWAKTAMNDALEAIRPIGATMREGQLVPIYALEALREFNSSDDTLIDLEPEEAPSHRPRSR